MNHDPDIFDINGDDRAPDEARPPEERDATLVSVLYHNAATSFLVGRFESPSGGTFTGTGEMFSPHVGDSYTLVGDWTTHPKYGRQFRWSTYETQYPKTASGIEQYLASGLIKGIGLTTAKRIVRKFGVGALEILNTDIGRLLEVDGIGERKLEIIRLSWEQQRSVQNVMLFLKSHGIGTGYAVRIHRAYGGDAIARVTEDPYAMVGDVEGIGFVIADRIARRLGLDANDDRRLRAGILYVLEEAARSEGHTFLPREECVRAAAAVLESSEEHVSPALTAAADAAGVVAEDDRIYAPVLYAAERMVADLLAVMLRRPPANIGGAGLSANLARAERRLGVEFSPHQAEAVSRCFAAPVVIVTGGPGTGKTTTVAGILALADDLDWTAAVCAPTGRAAKRLAEVTGHEARTIHRLLEFDPMSWTFQRDEDHPIDARIVIVDEMSMVDIQLMAALLRAVPAGAHLILVGDADQLPSVGPGNVLHDLIGAGCIETIALRRIFRQEESSSIIANAHRVRNGMEMQFGGETLFVEAHSGEDIIARIIELLGTDLMWGRPFDPLRDIQVLSPMHNTLPGVRNLNLVMQRLLNKGGRVLVQRADATWKTGDKVMQIRNNYEKDIFNGDIGFIVAMNADEDGMIIDFDGREVEYSFDDMDNLVHAFAITIHKSQGSEYPAVIVPVTMQHRIMLQRNLLYTAMTRAKSLLVFVGQKTAIATAIHNDRIAMRHTALADRLRGMFR